LLREPMFAAKTHDVPTGPQWLMEPKYDGWRVIASTTDGVRLETRTGNEITQVPYIAAALAERLPKDTIIDGEIVALNHGRQWNRTQEILSTTRGGYQHNPADEDPALTYVVFDVLQIDGEDLRKLTLVERKARLVELLPDLADGGVLMHCPVQPPSEDGLDQLVAEGYEGVVVKDIYSVYACGGRRHGWLKIKPEEEIEAVCTGTYPAEPGSKYAPLVKGEPQPWAVGGICFMVEHPDGRTYEGRAAGMDDQLRGELHEHPERFIGLIVELRHWGVQESGALRHPNYRRFRSPTDKAGVKPAGTRKAPRRASAKASPPPPTNGQRRMRNYQAMGKPKLIASIDSLEKKEGEAYDKCMSIGSGDPDADLVVARRVAREKQFI
jgi:ATP-dependent DNA ligase